MTFSLDSRLEDDSTFIIDLKLCQARLHHNAAFPWLLLIPKNCMVFEVTELIPSDQQLLMRETVLASQVMLDLFKPTKINVASLGNIIPQLHVHIIARYKDDGAWPNPVWNSGISIAYTAQTKFERLGQLRDSFSRKLLLKKS